MNCPIPSLANEPLWLVFKLMPNNDGSQRKVPFYSNGYPRSGKLDSPDDRSKLVTFEAALRVVENNGDRYAGVGAALGPLGDGWNLVGIDFDNVPDEHRHEFERNLLEECQAFGYALTRSVSGKGYHIYALSQANGYALTKAATTYYGVPCFVERYYAGRFFAEGTSLYAPDELCELVDSGVIHAAIEQASSSRAATERAPTPATLSDEERSAVLAEAETLLADLDPDMTEPDWAAVGQALVPCGDEGRALFASWSMDGAKWNADDFEHRWESWTRNRPEVARGIGTIRELHNKYALKGGMAELGELFKQAGLTVTPFAEKVARQAVEPEPQAPIELPTETGLRLDLFENLPPEPSFVVETLMPADLNSLYGASGESKSTVSLYEHLHIALGRPLYGRFGIERPGKVVYVGREDSIERIEYRVMKLLDALGWHRDIRALNANFHLLDTIALGLPPLVQLAQHGNIESTGLVEMLTERYPDAVSFVFDPLVDFGAGDENDNRAAARLNDALRLLSRSTGAAVTLIAHQNKQAQLDRLADLVSIRGASSIGAALRGGRYLGRFRQRPDDGPTPNAIPERAWREGDVSVMQLTKLSDAKLPTGKLWLLRDGWGFKAFEDATEEERAAARVEAESAAQLDLEARVLAAFDAVPADRSDSTGSWWSRALVLSQVQGKDATKRAAFARLVASGALLDRAPGASPTSDRHAYRPVQAV